jgi:hypothetical protein
VEKTSSPDKKEPQVSEAGQRLKIAMEYANRVREQFGSNTPVSAGDVHAIALLECIESNEHAWIEHDHLGCHVAKTGIYAATPSADREQLDYARVLLTCVRAEWYRHTSYSQLKQDIDAFLDTPRERLARSSIAPILDEALACLERHHHTTDLMRRIVCDKIRAHLNAASQAGAGAEPQDRSGSIPHVGPADAAPSASGAKS